jgi:hypothetical protein
VSDEKPSERSVELPGVRDEVVTGSLDGDESERKRDAIGSLAERDPDTEAPDNQRGVVVIRQ